MCVKFNIRRGRLAQWKTVRFVKFSSKGTAVQISPRGFLFSREFISQKGLTAIPNYRTCYIKLTQP